MALLDDVKLALRISNTSYNSEITDLIEAAKLDLILSGVVNDDYTDSLLKRAIVIYCKANFGMSNPDSEKFQKSYDLLKSHLSLAADYNGGDE
jgi:hypothetical protein